MVRSAHIPSTSFLNFNILHNHITTAQLSKPASGQTIDYSNSASFPITVLSLLGFSIVFCCQVSNLWQSFLS